MYTFGKIFMRQDILLGHFLSDRGQSAERFSACPHHFPSHVLPPGVNESMGKKVQVGISICVDA